MKERIIRFNWGTKRENLHFFFGQREKLPKTGAFARHIHVNLSIGSTPPPGGLTRFLPRYDLWVEVFAEIFRRCQEGLVETDVIGSGPDLIQLTGHLRRDIVGAGPGELRHISLQVC